ncbi:hypothetical protein [Ruminococcus sp. XPD3002]|uniref:hypothetical protein n=1 Tax=Ruminococcus sp. XPD3002 TaxID=1452269 RepID=UPI00090EEFD8|nr:hypothetical protein SAMN04487832_101211 [Ruminococcus flavefaciens]
MKKGLFAICMAAVMLTGCGNAATSGESTVDTSSKADTASSAVSDDESKDEANSETETPTEQAEEELNYSGSISYDVEIPYPARLYKHTASSCELYATDEVSNPDYNEDTVVYFAVDSSSYDVPDTLEDFLEKAFSTDLSSNITDIIYSAYSESAIDCVIDSKEEKEVLGYKALRVSGRVSLYNDDRQVNFAAYVSKFKDWDGKEDEAVMWIAFTISNNEKELNDMNYFVDLSLTKAKLNDAMESYKEEQ